MNRFMLKSKIHRATVTGVELNYEGSITVDKGLLEKADILPGEQVHELNCNNGNRCVTYAIPAPRPASSQTRCGRDTTCCGRETPCDKPPCGD